MSKEATPMARLRRHDRVGRLDSALLALDRAERSLIAARAAITTAKSCAIDTPHARCNHSANNSMEFIGLHVESALAMAHEADALLTEVLT